jgi:hypothetical protein
MCGGEMTENKPDKGQKDGSCNVTACQVPLKGRRQGWMVNHTVENGRYYYCASCCRKFNEWDDKLIRAGQETARRITWDETTPDTTDGVILDGDGTDRPGGFEGLGGSMRGYNARKGYPTMTYTLGPGRFGSLADKMLDRPNLKLRKGELRGLYGAASKRRLF